jgi:periplasmic divalent cation tolerance protein
LDGVGVERTVVVVLITAPSREVAESLVQQLVAERLAACGNIVPGVTSIYRWEGAVERADELLIVCKTTRAMVPRLLSRVEELHPYDVPEALVLPIEAGLAPYLGWVTANSDG